MWVPFSAVVVDRSVVAEILLTLETNQTKAQICGMCGRYMYCPPYRITPHETKPKRIARIQKLPYLHSLEPLSIIIIISNHCSRKSNQKGF